MTSNDKPIKEISQGEKLLALVLSFEFPLHSIGVFNPSVFTVRKFGVKERRPEDIQALKEGQILSLILNILFVTALYTIYKKKAPIVPLMAALTSFGVFLYYWGIIEGKF